MLGMGFEWGISEGIGGRGKGGSGEEEVPRAAVNRRVESRVLGVSGAIAWME